MAGTPLLRRYAKLERWAERLSPVQYSILMGAVFATVWAVMEVILREEPIWIAAFLGLPGGTIIGGLVYFWRKSTPLSTRLREARRTICASDTPEGSLFPLSVHIHKCQHS